MRTERNASIPGISGARALSDAYRGLNSQRLDIDRNMTILAPDDPARDVLWQELESVLARLRDIVGDLAGSPAEHLSELRDKADVLATLLRPDGTGSGPVIPDEERVALALSLTDDVVRLSAGWHEPATTGLSPLPDSPGSGIAR
jgi:hypothetical protein